MTPHPDAHRPHATEQTCADVQAALALLGRAWCGAVLAASLGGARRYREYRAALPRISDAVLAARLRELCEYGLLERDATTRAATYSPTQVGADVQPVLDALTTLVKRHSCSFPSP